MSRDFPTLGGSQYIDTGTWNLGGGSELTVCCSIEFDDLSGAVDPRFFSKAFGTDANSHQCMIGRVDSGGQNALRSRLRLGSTTWTTIIGSNHFNTTEWHHVAFRYDRNASKNNDGITHWHQGVKIGTNSAPSGTIDSSSINPCYIGNQPQSAAKAHAIDGRICQVLVIRRALDDDELFSIAKGMPVTRFCEGPSITLLAAPLGIDSPEPDFSGNGNTGSITGSVPVGDHTQVAPLWPFSLPYEVFAGGGGGGPTLKTASDTMTPALVDTQGSLLASVRADALAPAMTEVQASLLATGLADTLTPAFGETAGIVVAVAASDAVAPATTETSLNSLSSALAEVLTPSLGELQASALASGVLDSVTPSIGEVVAVSVVVAAVDGVTPSLTEVGAIAISLAASDTLTPSLSEAIAGAATMVAADIVAPALGEVVGIASISAVNDALAPALDEAAAAVVQLTGADSVTITLTESSSLVTGGVVELAFDKVTISARFALTLDMDARFELEPTIVVPRFKVNPTVN